MRNGKGKIPAIAVAMILVVVGVAGAAGAAAYEHGRSVGTIMAVKVDPSLSLQYRSVSDSGDCDDYGWGLPCGECVWGGGESTSAGSGYTTTAVCSDLLTANGAKQSWHAYYYSNSAQEVQGVNIGETTGTLSAGQSMQFFFGLYNGCADFPVHDLIKIVGPYNTVWIGYSGCG